jgi:uroporphyrinogen decarboxylase
LSGLKRTHAGERIPKIVFTKGGGAWLEDIATAGPDAVGLDWTVDIGSARSRVGDRVALQGNLDPSVLFGTPERIREEVMDVLQRFGRGTGHVFNLGHGVSQHTDPEHVRVLVDTVHEASRAYH